MNGWKAAGGGIGGTGLVGGLVYSCGLWGLAAVVVVALVVLVVAQCDLRWVLSDDRRTDRYVAARTGTRLPPSAPAKPSEDSGPPGRSRWWPRRRRRPPAGAS
jgi:hypothetical protein